MAFSHEMALQKILAKMLDILFDDIIYILFDDIYLWFETTSYWIEQNPFWKL